MFLAWNVGKANTKDCMWCRDLKKNRRLKLLKNRRARARARAPHNLYPLPGGDAGSVAPSHSGSHLPGRENAAGRPRGGEESEGEP